LQFAHSPFSTEQWEKFLGFGENEMSSLELVKKHKYKRVKIPLFSESNPNEVALIKRIVDSYSNQKVIFISEQDQFYRAQYGVLQDLRRKFFSAKQRMNAHIMYQQDHFNIGIHVRRGDISIGQRNNNSNLLMRWQNNEYFK